jgi:hypothetical protein
MKAKLGEARSRTSEEIGRMDDKAWLPVRSLSVGATAKGSSAHVDFGDFPSILRTWPPLRLCSLRAREGARRGRAEMSRGVGELNRHPEVNLLVAGVH